MSDTVIVGAGVTGLHLAKLLGPEKPTVVSWGLGGLLRQHDNEGFVFDYGGHVYTCMDERINKLMEAVGAQRHERKAVYLHGSDCKYVPYPVQDHAEQIGLTTPPKASLLMAFHNLRDLGMAYFGEQFYKEFFAPFNRRIWCADPIEMDTDWIRNRVKLPAEKKEKWGPNAEFWYAPGEHIITRMYGEAQRAGASFYDESQVGALDLPNKILTLRSRNGQRDHEIRYKRLFWTASLKSIAYLVGISRDVFRNNGMMTIGIGLRDMLNWEHFNWAYFDVRLRPHRVTWLSRYHPSMAPEGKDSLLIEIPFKWPDYPPPLYTQNIPFNLRNYVKHYRIRSDVVIRTCKDTNLLFDSKLIEVCSAGTTRGYPLQTRGLRSIVAETKRRLMKHDVFTAGRWGSWGYFNLDHCFDDAEAAVDAEKERDRYLYSRAYYR